MRVYVVRIWPLRGRSHFVCWNITRVSLWLLCNVHFVQSTQRTRLQTIPCDLADLKARIIPVVKNIDAPMLTRVWQELEYRIDVCRVTSGAHIEHLYLSKKRTFCSFPLAVNNFIKIGPLVLVTNICNHREHYETPYIYIYIYIFHVIIPSSFMTITVERNVFYIHIYV